MGYSSYTEYLRGPEWANLKLRYEASRLPKKCRGCFDPHHELHHRTYKRLGRESLNDLIPLCRSCHARLHRKGLALWDGHRELRPDQYSRLSGLQRMNEEGVG